MSNAPHKKKHIVLVVGLTSPPKHSVILDLCTCVCVNAMCITYNYVCIHTYSIILPICDFDIPSSGTKEFTASRVGLGLTACFTTYW